MLSQLSCNSLWLYCQVNVKILQQKIMLRRKFSSTFIWKKFTMFSDHTCNSLWQFLPLHLKILLLKHAYHVISTLLQLFVTILPSKCEDFTTKNHVEKKKFLNFYMKKIYHVLWPYLQLFVAVLTTSSGNITTQLYLPCYLNLVATLCDYIAK